jgi:sugar/nucleoside kinase (ribokinase family)
MATAHAILNTVQCKGVIITLGPDGAVLVSKDHAGYAPGFKVQAKETTGQGIFSVVHLHDIR